MGDIKAQWEQRQRELGNTTRAVLFKNLPEGFNDRLHRAHVRFLVGNLPAVTRTLLDVGCGYGRTAAAIKDTFPAIDINGVELCEEFARAFEASIGPCFMGSVAQFHTTKDYDAITIVTLLMYLDREEQQAVLAKLWKHLRPGGRMLLIEPYFNLLISWRRKFRVQTLAPTGGEVAYFRHGEFVELLSTAIPEARLTRMTRFNMPFAGFPTLHLGAVLEKPGKPSQPA
jgi:SAM-dependent methyltransferase